MGSSGGAPEGCGDYWKEWLEIMGKRGCLSSNRRGSGPEPRLGIQVAHRGTTMATGSWPGSRPNIWVGTVVGPPPQEEEKLEPVCPQAARHQDPPRGSGLLSRTSSRGGIGPSQGGSGGEFQVARGFLGTLRAG